MAMFKKAVKDKIKLRIALSGPSGAGKTYSALNMAKYIGKRIAVIDTEHSSSLRYAHKFDFDFCNLEDHRPAAYIEAIETADEEGYDVIIVDSFSHAWYKILEMAGDNLYGWKKARPQERKLIEAILNCKSHVIVTMRERSEYLEDTEKGRKVMRKVGTESVQNKDINFEFDVALKISRDHIADVDKTRCEDIEGKTFLNPGKELAEKLLAWANNGNVKQLDIDDYEKIQHYDDDVEEDPEEKTLAKAERKLAENPAPEPPKIWQTWKSAEDAIDWAQSILMDADPDFITAEFNKLPAVKGRGILWVEKIDGLLNSGKYKKIQQKAPANKKATANGNSNGKTAVAVAVPETETIAVDIYENESEIQEVEDSTDETSVSSNMLKKVGTTAIIREDLDDETRVNVNIIQSNETVENALIESNEASEFKNNIEELDLEF